MLFKPGTPLYAFEVEKEGEQDVIYINYLGAPFVPSIANNPEVMSKVVDTLTKTPNISRIIFVQQRNYSHDFSQVVLLQEIANLYTYLTKQEKILAPNKLSLQNFDVARRYELISYLLALLKADPLACCMSIQDEIFSVKTGLDRLNENSKYDYGFYLKTLEKFYGFVSNLSLIKTLENNLEGYKMGDRSLYERIFRADIVPNFTFTRLASQLPKNAEIEDQYEIGTGYDQSTVIILKRPEEVKYFYHLIPPEYTLNEEHHLLLNLARNVLIEHQPKAEEFTDPERIRQVFLNVAKDLLQELAENQKITLTYTDLNKLGAILVRHTIGFGLIEILLQDKEIQDIVLNAPITQNPIYLRHGKYDECSTNILPSQEDADSWAAKFRMISGRPLDEANPILDADLSIGTMRARIAVIQEPLSPSGLAYAIRRHRESPWTLPLFIKNKMINPFAAGLMSFLVDGSRCMLVAGTRSSGKTSLLGSLMLEIMPKYRIITIEDTPELAVETMRKLKYDILRMKVRSALLQTSTEVAADEGIRTSLRLGDSCLIVGEVRSSIRGNEEVVIIDNGIMKRIQIKDLEGKDLTNILVPTINFNLKNEISSLRGFVKHPKRDKLLRIKTRTGREIIVTHDHSLFSPTKNFEIAPIECKNLKAGTQIVIPSFISCGFNDKDTINLFDYLLNFRVEGFESYVRKAIKVLGWRKATEICKITSGDIYNYFRTNEKTNILFSSFKSLMNEAKVTYNFKDLKVKKGTSLALPAIIPINKDFCRFLGYYVSEGYYSLGKSQGGKVVISNSNKEIIKDITQISQNLFGFEQKTRVVKSLGTSVQNYFNCLPLAEIISKLGCGRTCYEKRVPSLIFGLSKEKIASFLRGLYSGDGCFTSSNSSGNCVRYFSTSKKLVEDIAYLLLNFRIVATIRNKKPTGIGKQDLWILEFKDREMVETFINEIGFNRKIPKMLVRAWKHTKSNSIKFDKALLKEHLIKYPRKYRHLFRFLRCSKNYLKEVVLDSRCEVSKKLKTFALGDFFLDEVKEIEEINLKESEYVYDLSVEPMQNFVGGFGGLLLHNTEARALFEAMRVGALANVVAGTIHGASPYGVFDRVVNDLQVPITSFKAIDSIIVANPVKTADGMHSVRRVMQVSEIRKNWVKDPLEEKGFVDLLSYNVEKDELEISEDMINGDSEIIKDIASGVKGWAGNWDAIYDNILLRARVKQELVNISDQLKKPELLEAGFNVLSNSMFHQISDKIRAEIGLPLGKRVFPEWQKWLMKEVKAKKI